MLLSIKLHVATFDLHPTLNYATQPGHTPPSRKVATVLSNTCANCGVLVKCFTICFLKPLDYKNRVRETRRPVTNNVAQVIFCRRIHHCVNIFRAYMGN